MSMKSEYLLQFPIQQTEEKCMINPMHLEPAVTIAMGEHNSPVCLVCDQNKNTMMIATWEPDKKFKFFYPDTSERTELHLVYGPSEFIEVVDSDDMEEALMEAGAIDETSVSTRFKTFHSQEEADAYVQGVEDAMYVTDHEDDYRFVDEEKYNKLRDIWNNGEV